MLTLTLTTTTDLSPMLEQLARRSRLAAGETPPDAAELTQLKAAVAKDLDTTRAEQAKTLKARLSAELPKGMRLKKLDSARDGLVVTSNTTLELDDVALLPDVVLAADEGQPPFKPFAGFVVKRDKAQVTVSGRAPALPEGAGTLALTLASTTAPTSHNAATVEAGALQWSGSGFDVKVVYPR